MVAENDNKNIMNINDPLDINELASLNDDISAEFIEQLQNQITQNSNLIEKKSETTDVSELFEEVQNDNEANENFVPKLDDSIDDNFIKKYKAKIEKQKKAQFDKTKESNNSIDNIDTNTNTDTSTNSSEAIKAQISITKDDTNIIEEEDKQEYSTSETEQIEHLTNGNIIEKPISSEQIEYNETLDYLDDNVKYSKYVIYIDPENTEFIESLTVKERKNLINRILKEQDNIVITQKKLNLMQTYIKHAIIAILTIAIATPAVYFTVNASLEATINNHRRSLTLFKTLYKEKGKIKNIKY